MEAVRSISGQQEEEEELDSVQYLKENQIEAVKSLAVLLLREVESMKKTPSDASEVLSENGSNLLERTQQYEMDLIRAALIKSGGSQRKAAKLLGTKETTLNVKIKRYGIDLAKQHKNPKT